MLPSTWCRAELLRGASSSTIRTSSELMCRAVRAAVKTWRPRLGEGGFVGFDVQAYRHPAACSHLTGTTSSPVLCRTRIPIFDNAATRLTFSTLSKTSCSARRRVRSNYVCCRLPHSQAIVKGSSREQRQGRLVPAGAGGGRGKGSTYEASLTCHLPDSPAKTSMSGEAQHLVEW